MKHPLSDSPSHGLLGRLAVQLGMLSVEQLYKALDLQGRMPDSPRFGHLLLDLGFIKKDQLDQLLEAQREWEKRQNLQENTRLQETQRRLAQSLPLDKELTEVLSEGESGTPETTLELDVEVGVNSSPVSTLELEVEVGADSSPVSSLEAEVEIAPEPHDAPLAVVDKMAEPGPITATTLEIAPTPAADLIKLLRLALDKGASDVHIQAGAPPFLRCHGRILRVGVQALSEEVTNRLLFSLLTSEQRDQFEEQHDLAFAYQFPSGLRLRVSCFQSFDGPGMVVRLIPPYVPSLLDLHLPKIVARMVTFHQGLVMIVGPSGCGKSSTVAALVRLLNEERKLNIVMLEEIIEFIHKPIQAHIIQRQVPTHSDSFSTALRAALREDPDVIVVGEMRELETISLALSAAETGHLVLGTLHTRDCTGTIDRVISVFPADQRGQVKTMLGETLRGVVAQRLIPKTQDMARVPIIEVLFNTTNVGALIRAGDTFQLPNAIQMGGKEGMCRFEDSLARLVRRGIVDPTEARRYAST